METVMFVNKPPFEGLFPNVAYSVRIWKDGREQVVWIHLHALIELLSGIPLHQSRQIPTLVKMLQADLLIHWADVDGANICSLREVLCCKKKVAWEERVYALHILAVLRASRGNQRDATVTKLDYGRIGEAILYFL